MLTRLLVAMLMLTGPVPVRVCTCAAASVPCDSICEVASSPAPLKNCGCRHRSHTESPTTDESARVNPRTSSTADDVPQQERHDRDCPAVNPLPPGPAAVPSPIADHPTDSGFGITLWAEPLFPGHSRPAMLWRTEPTGQAIPLYLSLLTLRI